MNVKVSGILLSAALLTACGGDDSSSNNGLNISINESALLSAPSQPSLTSATVNDADSIILHSRNTGTIGDRAILDFNYLAQADVDNVLVRLTSGAEDLDLTVRASDYSVSEYADTSSSEEYIIFDAADNMSYSVSVESYEGSGNFELILTTLNRETLKLSGGENLVKFSITGNGNCSDGSYSINDDTYSVINWKKGYIRTLNSDFKESFSAAEGSSFTIKTSDQETEDGYSYTSQESFTLTVNPETAVISGTGSGSSTEVDGETITCTWNLTFNGQVLL
ncbi:hypothetical protein [Thalassolituus hydrocarboniclasticus]|uniref:Lipoprotein n=1 Tax=Thalassolituus hydrocarboniclasticus TaxID=2742796 RepID=A0ABY6A639_9GAMM|nr:hypothetical protein [Thalassolituus hydrocarboniclasticus]UXD86160.1 hypothetical protein HUF19_01255 [Thalassolituus hydrocarboniclasticus]